MIANTRSDAIAQQESNQRVVIRVNLHAQFVQSNRQNEWEEA